MSATLTGPIVVENVRPLEGSQRCIVLDVQIYVWETSPHWAFPLLSRPTSPSGPLGVILRGYMFVIFSSPPCSLSVQTVRAACSREPVRSSHWPRQGARTARALASQTTYSFVAHSSVGPSPRIDNRHPAQLRASGLPLTGSKLLHEWIQAAPDLPPLPHAVPNCSTSLCDPPCVRLACYDTAGPFNLPPHPFRLLPLRIPPLASTGNAAAASQLLFSTIVHHDGHCLLGTLSRANASFVSSTGGVSDRSRLLCLIGRSYACPVLALRSHPGRQTSLPSQARFVSETFALSPAHLFRSRVVICRTVKVLIRLRCAATSRGSVPDAQPSRAVASAVRPRKSRTDANALAKNRTDRRLETLARCSVRKSFGNVRVP
jgi:hypothetical protein